MKLKTTHSMGHVHTPCHRRMNRELPPSESEEEEEEEEEDDDYQRQVD